MEVDFQNPNHMNNPNQEHYLVQDEKKRLRCVCQLCTCGNHKCPRPRIKGTFATSYNDHYKDIKLTSPPPQRQEYRYQQRHYNPEAMRTNYQQTYVPMQLNYGTDSPSKLETYGSRVLNQVPFVGQSSYKDQYKPFIIKPNSQNPQQDNIFRTKSVPNEYYKPVKFEGTTSYKSQFVEPPKLDYKPMPTQNYQRVPIPFNGSSSYKNDYPGYKIENQVPTNDGPAYLAPHVKFEGSTSYNDQFKGYKLMVPENQLSKSRHTCIVEKLGVPPVNHINDEQHIYYDHENKKFV